MSDVSSSKTEPRADELDEIDEEATGPGRPKQAADLEDPDDEADEIDELEESETSRRPSRSREPPAVDSEETPSASRKDSKSDQLDNEELDTDAKEDEEEDEDEIKASADSKHVRLGEEEEEIETHLLGVSETRPSRTRSVDSTTSTRIHSKSSSSVTHETNEARVTDADSAIREIRDKADDKLNGIMNEKHGPLETKWIILVVAIGVILFTLMATAAFLRRRMHRAKQAELKRLQEKEDFERAAEEKQRAREEEELEEQEYEEPIYWQRQQNTDNYSYQRRPDDEAFRGEDVYRMDDRKPFGVV